MSYMDVELTNYTGVRDKRADSCKNRAAAKEQRAAEPQTAEERKKAYEDMGIHAERFTVDISPESQEFMAQVAERKAAQAAEKAKLEAENPWSSFDYRGDLSKNEPTQYLVFSKFLYDKGVFRDLDDEQAGKMEDMLRNITSGMDSIRGPLDAGRWDNSMSHEAAKLDLVSSDGEHSYIVDIQRKGYINYIKKCTYQSRFRKDVILLRLDVEGPEHTNPSGEKLPSTHLHVYREGLDDKFAIPAPPEFSNTDDLIQTMIDFLVYFKTTNTDSLEIETVM